MKIDDLTLIGGCDIVMDDGVVIQQPTLGMIRDPRVGQARYGAYVNILALTLDDLSQNSAVVFPENTSLYVVLLAIPELRGMLTEALSFFLGGVVFRSDTFDFETTNGSIVNQDNFDDVRSVILRVCCVSTQSAIKPKFRSKKAQEIYEKIARGREQLEKAKHREGKAEFALANLISAVSAKSPTYNLTNIWDLTVYQLYDQFGRLNVNNQIDIIGLRWAAWGKDDFDFTTWYTPQNRQQADA